MPDHDRMQLTLSSLRADVERTPLADSSAVRRRGDQRTRRQAVGASLAAVVLVVTVGGVAGSLFGGTDRVQAPIATNPPTATSSSPAPPSSPSSAAALRTDVPAEALLTASDLGLSALTSSTTDGFGVETLNPCLLGSGDLVGSGHVVFTAAGGAIVASEFVITQKTDEAARTQLDGYRNDLRQCGGSFAGGPVRAVTAVDLTPAQTGALGEGAWAFRVRQPGGATDGGDLSAYAVGVRAGNAITVLAFDTGTFGGSPDQAIVASIAARDRLAATFTR